MQVQTWTAFQNLPPVAEMRDGAQQELVLGALMIWMFSVGVYTCCWSGTFRCRSITL